MKMKGRPHGGHFLHLAAVLVCCKFHCTRMMHVSMTTMPLIVQCVFHYSHVAQALLLLWFELV